MSNKKSFYDIAKKLEEADENKWYLVWIRCGAFFVAIESSAIILSEELNSKRTCLKPGVCKVGFPVESLFDYVKKLENIGISFVIYNYSKYVRSNTYACNTYLHLCIPHSNNLEKLTNYVIEQIKTRCNEFLDGNKYMQVANSSKDKILKDRFNFKNEILVLEKKLKDITRTMMVSLIDRIEVSEDKEITIYYKFNILNMRKLNDEEKIIIVIII